MQVLWNSLYILRRAKKRFIWFFFLFYCKLNKTLFFEKIDIGLMWNISPKKKEMESPDDNVFFVSLHVNMQFYGIKESK